MSYVETQLLPNETVRYTAHLHWMIFIAPVLLGLVTAIAVVLAARGDIPWVVVALPAGLELISSTSAAIRYSTSEFAITDKRVIIKVGFIQLRTLETILSKVEAVGVDQSVWGRMFDFGTITLTGTGGTKENFDRIAAPLDFRKQVHAAIVDSGAPSHERGALARDERECPYCAERVLVRARVCKHCGRELATT